MLTSFAANTEAADQAQDSRPGAKSELCIDRSGTGTLTEADPSSSLLADFEIAQAIDDAEESVRGQPWSQHRELRKGELDQKFFGQWQVTGTRTQLLAEPQLESAVGIEYPICRSFTWKFKRLPRYKEYWFSNDNFGRGESWRVSLPVGGGLSYNRIEYQGSTTILRYRGGLHRVLIAMQLRPDGKLFDGIGQITIDELILNGKRTYKRLTPNAKVTYKFVGIQQAAVNRVQQANSKDKNKTILLPTSDCPEPASSKSFTEEPGR